MIHQSAYGYQLGDGTMACARQLKAGYQSHVSQIDEAQSKGEYGIEITKKT